MEGLRFINLNDIMNKWPLETVLEVVAKVKEYTDSHGLDGVYLHEVENLTYEDPENQRYNIDIRYINENNSLIQQRLLMLKGTVYNCNEVHERRDEFFTRKEIRA